MPRGIKFPSKEMFCERCGKNFICVASDFKSRKYCSRRCYHNSQPPVIKQCKYCAKDFSVSKYKAKDRFYCSRLCGTLWHWKDHKVFLTSPNIKKYIKTLHNSCQRCGYDKNLNILQIHHKDRNRKNNTIDNVELICPNCHEEEHWNNKDGRYSNNLGVKDKAQGTST